MFATFSRSMSTDPFAGNARHRWARPLTLAYSNHSSNFLCGQIIVWSRLLFAIGTDVLLWSDYVAIVVLILGVLLGLPYVLSAFRENEIVVEGGPSLVSDVIPEWVASATLLVAVLVFWIADRLIGTNDSLGPAWFIYLVISLVGLGASILSARNQKDRALVSVVLLILSLHEAGEFPDITIRTILACSCILSYLFDAYAVRGARELIHRNELRMTRVNMIVKLLLALSIIFVSLNALSTIFIAILFVLQCSIHIGERKWGTLEERAYLNFVAPRDNLPQVPA